MDAKINLNYPIKVKLTQEGIRFYEREHMETRMNLLNNTNNELDIGDFELIRDDEGYTEFVGWKFMQLFGSQMYAGSAPLFDLNIIATRCEEVV